MRKIPTYPRKSIPNAEVSDWCAKNWQIVGPDPAHYRYQIIEWPHTKPPVAPYKVAAIPATVEGMVA